MTAVLTDDTLKDSPGVPYYMNESVRSIASGMILEDILWSTDRGNAIWDGVLIALRSMGVKTANPIP